MQTHIREFQASDKASCMEAFLSNVPTFFTVAEIDLFEQFLDKQINAVTREENVYFYTVVYNGQVVGCGGFGDKQNTSKLTFIWGLIHADFHKKGLGEKLLNYRIQEIKRIFPSFELCLDTSQHCYGFFEKFGFKTTQITKDYYTVGMHRYDMVYVK